MNDNKELYVPYGFVRNLPAFHGLSVKNVPWNKANAYDETKDQDE